METTITNILLKNVNDVTKREIEVSLSNGHIVHIIACYESWQQYGGTIEDKQTTMPIADKFNSWLHGEEE